MTQLDGAGVARRRRPFGVVALIALNVAVALLALLALAAAVAAVATGNVASLADDYRLAGPLGPLLLIAELAATLILNLAAVIGLWQLRRWAWTLTILLVGLSMFGNLRGYYFGDPDYLDMALDVMIVFYLNLRETRAAFEPRGQDRRL